MSRLILQLDARLVAAVKLIPAPARPLMEFATLVGQPLTTSTLLGGLGLMYALSQMSAQAWACGAAIGAIVLTNILKLLFRRTRPDTYVPFIFHSYSFPSGHAAASMIGFGLTAWLTMLQLALPWSAILAVVLVGLIMLVGISRVHLGAHYPTDVLGGWGVGLAILFIIITVFRL